MRAGWYYTPWYSLSGSKSDLCPGDSVTRRDVQTRFGEVQIRVWGTWHTQVPPTSYNSWNIYAEASA